MLKETITYEDFNGVTQTKDFYFNISRADFAKIELNYQGGIEGYLKKIIDDGNGRKIIEFFEDVIKDSYGVRSADGSEFVKTQESYERFKGTGAYQNILEKVLDDPDYALNFIRGCLPGKYQDALRQKEAEMATAGFRPGAQTLPQSRIDQLAAQEEAAKTPTQPVQVPETFTENVPQSQPTYLENLPENGYATTVQPQHATPVENPTQPVEQGDVIAYTNSAPVLNIQPPLDNEAPLAPHEPGYSAGLTRRQARETGLIQ